MTFKEIQDKVLDRLNLSSDEARARISGFINERYRNVATSCNLGRTRRGLISIDTVAGQDEQPLVDKDDATKILIKPLTIKYDDRIPMVERSLDAIRSVRAVRTGVPEVYAVVAFEPEGATVHWFPRPDATYTILVDGLIAGTSLVEDDDTPAFPEDFHDLLVFGSLADEYDHFDRTDAAMKQEAKFDKRLSQLRYFLQLSIHMSRVQNAQHSPQSLWWRLI